MQVVLLRKTPLIEEAYEATMQIASPKKCIQAPKFTYNTTKLKETIFSRRSQRGFNEGAITKGQFNFIMEMIHQPILSDCDEEVNIYVVVNRVLDMPLGLYKEESISSMEIFHVKQAI